MIATVTDTVPPSVGDLVAAIARRHDGVAGVQARSAVLDDGFVLTYFAVVAGDKILAQSLDLIEAVELAHLATFLDDDPDDDDPDDGGEPAPNPSALIDLTRLRHIEAS